MDGKVSAEERAASKKCLTALSLSAVVLFAGMWWTFKVGDEANRNYHSLYHAKEGLQDLKGQLKASGRNPK